MTDDARPPPSTLKGRLADVYVPALVDGALEALSRRLGNRATIDDPAHGRASSVASLEALVARASETFRGRGARYRHVYSTTGISLDAAEGVLSLRDGTAPRELPICVIAQRRRLREIELRIYYAAHDSTPHAPRGPIMGTDFTTPIPPALAPTVDALRGGDVEKVIAGFEEQGGIVDAHGRKHLKTDGNMASFLAQLGAMMVLVSGSADDGRTCCLEAMIAHGGRDPAPAVLSLERGDTGLVRELRVYWDCPPAPRPSVPSL